MKQRAATVFKFTVYSLLLLNVWLLSRITGGNSVPYKALDQIGWLLILGVFEWETRAPAGNSEGRRLLGWPLGFELLGYGFALFALVNYWHDRIWLDVGNAIAWLAISAMIWLDILRPLDAGMAAHRWRGGIKLMLYAATFACAVLWGIAGAALDFYDAMLWILCFFVIELNLIRLEKPARRIFVR